jgi:hypothetical protein
MSPVDFRGGKTCSCVALSLPWVELDMKKRGLIVSHIDIFQLGYRTNVAASNVPGVGNTHAEGGCTDVGQYHPGQIECWRDWGWTMQKRLLTDVMPHAHGWPYKCPHLAPAAELQERNWDQRDAGLAGDAKVVGQWPVLPWRDAFRRNVMGLLDDLTDEIAAKVAKKVGPGLAAAVWDADVIPNVWGSPDNPNVRAKNALGEIGRDANAIRDKLQA